MDCLIPLAASVLLICLHLSPSIAQEAEPLSLDFESYFEGLDLEKLDPAWFDEYMLRLEHFFKHPIDLNTVEQSTLQGLSFLSTGQIESYLNYRQLHGALISKYELQAIPSFDLRTIQLLLPLCKVIQDNLQAHQLINSRQTNTLITSWERIFPQAKGYKSQISGAPRFVGDQNRLILRYFRSLHDRFRLGIICEKDAGEKLLNKEAKTGVDYLSIHLEAHKLSPLLTQLNVGDYHLNLGQGLIYSSTFNAAKGVDLTQIVKPEKAISAYRSLSESNSLRGASAVLSLNQHLRLVPFLSYQRRDANIVKDENWLTDTVRFSSLKTDGLHRTRSELDDQKKITHLIYGSSLQYHISKLRLKLNFLKHQFDHSYWPRETPYNLYAFRGKKLHNISLDYRWSTDQFYFFGETAMSDNDALATLNGCLFNPLPKLDLALLFRSISSQYQSIGSSAYTENSKPTNEVGYYFGINFRHNHSWLITSSIDFYNHPWQKYLLSGPSSGMEALLRATFSQKKHFEMYIQYVYKMEEGEFKGIGKYRLLANKIEYRLRLNYVYKRLSNWRFKSRLEYKTYKDPTKQSDGWLLYQDIYYQHKSSLLSFSSRFAYFKTDDFDSRIYAYENDLRYSFNIPFFYNEGLRTYINTRLKIKHLTVELRHEWTHYLDNKVEGFGSGDNFIEGNNRHEFKVQLSYSW